MTIFEDEMINIKAFEYDNLTFYEPWTLTNIMQNFEFDQKRILGQLGCMF